MPSAGGGKSPLGRAGTLRLHLKKAEKGWTQAKQSGTGPGVGNPEIAQAVAHIPQADICADVKMQDVRPPPGFEPEVIKAGYDVNLVRSDQPKQAHLPRLRRVKTGCWMLRKASPEHQEMAGRVTIPTRPLTIKLPGHYFGPVSPKSQITIS